MSIETSIDALCREFEIEDVRDGDKKPTSKAESDITEQTKLEDPVPATPEIEDPLGFLTEEVTPSTTSVPDLVHDIPEGEEAPTGPSVAEIKKKVKEEQKAIEKIEQDVNVAVISQRYSLEDKAFEKAQLKDLITSNRLVLDCIEQQLKIGTNPHLFEVYASLSKTVADHIMRLAKLDETITNYKIIEDKGNGNIKHDVAKEAEQSQGSPGNSYTQVNNYNFDTSALLKIINKIHPYENKVKEEDLPKFNLN